MAKIIEHAWAGYEVQEVEYGKVYTWRPEIVVVECDCSVETALTLSEAACKECGAEHTGVVREGLSDLQPLDDKSVHPWRYPEDGKDEGALPY